MPAGKCACCLIFDFFLDLSCERTVWWLTEETLGLWQIKSTKESPWCILCWIICCVFNQTWNSLAAIVFSQDLAKWTWCWLINMHLHSSEELFRLWLAMRGHPTANIRHRLEHLFFRSTHWRVGHRVQRGRCKLQSYLLILLDNLRMEHYSRLTATAGVLSRHFCTRGSNTALTFNLENSNRNSRTFGNIGNKDWKRGRPVWGPSSTRTHPDRDLALGLRLCHH